MDNFINLIDIAFYKTSLKKKKSTVMSKDHDDTAKKSQARFLEGRSYREALH
jgi:hypothetical protein